MNVSHMTVMHRGCDNRDRRSDQSTPFGWAQTSMDLLRTALMLVSFGIASSVVAAPVVDTVSASARDAQQQCHRLMHHDADEYEECIATLIRAAGQSRAKRLGISYFGWIGAMNSARVGLPGAQAAADRFLPTFRRDQKSLGISDDTLCTTVPGDCTVRLAQIRQAEAARR
jgi:hypothetical protein